jgi:hypothetical protein
MLSLWPPIALSPARNRATPSVGTRSGEVE